ncbi:9130_t:CDS:2 [Paraglomus occultum]|uniref:9130_t:CDS:1 n=1 Tax=Paraglomus occultum TaxID=144539 RepID=A0A9N8ZJU3_9GLOM|nr:9130_t:CDS:2 [Paraglomus occultum]
MSDVPHKVDWSLIFNDKDEVYHTIHKIIEATHHKLHLRLGFEKGELLGPAKRQRKEAGPPRPQNPYTIFVLEVNTDDPSNLDILFDLNDETLQQMYENAKAFLELEGVICEEESKTFVGIKMEETRDYKTVEESMPSIVSHESEPFEANVAVASTKKRKKERPGNNTRGDNNGKRSKLSGVDYNKLARVVWDEHFGLKMLYEIIAYYGLLHHKENNPDYKFTPKRRSKNSSVDQRNSRDGEPDGSDSEENAIHQECSYIVPDVPMVPTDVQGHTCIRDICGLNGHVDPAVSYE